MDPFNIAVIDEAAQVKECESIIALQIPNVRHAILVGDECQLPATVKSKVSEEAGYGRSLFERLSSLGHSKHLLNVQYRMHPSISCFPNSNFYHNRILDALNVQSGSYERRYLEGMMFGPYSFIDVREGKEQLDDVGHGRRNWVEVAVVVTLVHKLFKAWNGADEKLSIGLISPYAAQVAAIQNKLQRKYENVAGFKVKVRAIDGFQGGEEDIIIISTARSNSDGSIGFLSSPRRTNVALTRARHCLWIVGHERTLRKSYSIWDTLILDAKNRRCFFNADEDCDIKKSLVNIKTVLEDLEDLFNDESILFKNSRWKVSFSENFRKSLQKVKPPDVKKCIINVLFDIASGWRPKKINIDFTCERSSYILKQFKVEKYYVVCSVDIIKHSIYEQVLKVWDVLPMGETQRLFKRLDNTFVTYTDDFINHCKEKSFMGNLEVPKSWSISNEIIRFKTQMNTELSSVAADNRSYVENSEVSESLSLMKFYPFSSGSANHLLSEIDGREVNLPFEVTDEEREIIVFPKSSFILGRSGTGKTTILTMKMYRKIQQYCIASGDSTGAENSANISNKFDVLCQSELPGTNLRQLFITVSPKLCDAIKKHVSEMISIASGNTGNSSLNDTGDIDEMAKFSDIPDTFVGIQPEKYPLIITFHKFLMMLDGTLGNSYFLRFPDAREFCQHEGRRSVTLQNFIRKKEVTYDRFRSAYWDHFNTKLTKNLDPSRVFTEIMSHIKGGLQEGEACESNRSKDEYVSLSHNHMSTLSADTREMIYDIFENYEKMKLKRGEFDLADFVIDIHVRLKNNNLLGDKMDFVYIDEVQDLTMRQICLFRHICNNVDEGFVFCGDTAQTIAKGIDFRFEDIRSLFYNEFVMKSENHEFSGRREKGLISDIFRLSQNFRTHIGVLRLAQSVIDLICHFFPQSIDALDPETSRIHGDSPVVLEPGSNENSILTIFGHSGNGAKWVGFGADQVILVRDDAAKEKISKYIGHQALILTILECKGLEFQDVLLYDFFGSSPMSNQWRVVYEFLKGKNLLDAHCPKSFPSFSQSKHNILCSELKQLYVAITRTRQRLWICENNEEFSKPMLHYWKRLGYVQVRKIDDSLAEEMQRASSPEEWKSQGIKLFWAKHYEKALMCFQKAGEETWEKRARACGLRAAADNLCGSNSVEARAMLREAAEIFESIGRAESAAECFCDLREYERAGRIYLEKCSPSDLRKAGECFSLARCYKAAAEVYDKGNFFNDCLLACTKGNILDIGLQYIDDWRQQASHNSLIMMRFKEIEKIAQDFLEKWALECHTRRDTTSFMKYVQAFPTMESKRNFLESFNFLEELLILEEDCRNFIEAADVAKRLGDTVREVDLLEKGEEFKKASLLLISYVVSNSVWAFGSQGRRPNSFSQKEKFLTRAVSFAQKVSESFHASTCVETDILSCKSNNFSELMRCYFAAKQYETYTGEVLAIRKLLEAHFEVTPAEYEWKPEVNNDPTVFNERILRNKVSCGSLIYVWNLWKSESLKILEHLHSLDNIDFVKSDGLFRFCFDYFGVRLLNNLRVKFLLMNPNAAWVKNIDERVLSRNKSFVTLDARHFSSAAKRYFQQDFVSSGLRVLDALQALYKYSVSKRLSKFCQSMCLTYIFDVSSFFVAAKSFDLKEDDAEELWDSIALSRRYFEIVFPLDTRQSLSENLISLRQTERSKKLLEEVISRNLHTENELTYGQIGQIMMIILGSRRPKPGLYQNIVKRLSHNNPWEPFIQSLSRECESSHKYEVLVDEFHKALEETYHIGWGRKDYISPDCFIYLVERLLIMVFHSKGFFFTTKSSFVEFLIYLESDMNTVMDKKSDPSRILNSVFDMIKLCLCDRAATTKWIENSRINCKYYFPLLMLRLCMILCLLCLNSDLSINVVLEHVGPIRSELPREFCEGILRVKKDGGSYVDALAGAFKAIGDPLVIVGSTEKTSEFICTDAVFIDLRSFSCRNEIMKTLFSVERNVTECSRSALNCPKPSTR